MDDLDGVLFPGGADVSPVHFGGVEKRFHPYDRRRDILELRLLREARTRGLPVLAICRGAQLLNLSRGGTVHREVHKSYRDARYPRHPLAYMLFRKPVRIMPGTQISRIVADETLLVNSLHRQSIHRVGSELVVSGMEDNGVIQVVEDPTQRFCMGVQFHPELLIHRAVHRRLLRTFVNACRPGGGS